MTGKNRRIAKNVIVTVLTQLISWALTFTLTLYLPRYVGDTGLGKLAFAEAFVGLFGVLAPLGTSPVLVREVARDRRQTGVLLVSAVLLRLPTSLAVVAVTFGVIRLMRYPLPMQTLVLVTALGVVATTLNDALTSVLQGQENMPRRSAGILAEKALTTGLIILIIVRRGPLWAIAGVAAVTASISILINLTAFRSLFATLRWPGIAAVRMLALSGLPFMGYTVFQTLYGQTDPLVLGWVTNDATVGWYAAAFRLVGSSLFLPGAVTAALFPTLSRLHGESLAEFQQLTRRALALVMLFGVPVAFLLLAVPEQLIALLHYPRGFLNSIPVLRIGSVGVLLYYAAMVLGTAVMASDGQTKMLRAAISATVMGIPLCTLGSLLAHKIMGNGAVGAIASDVILEAYLVRCYLCVLPQGTFGLESLALMGRYLLASVPMALCLWLATAAGAGLWVLAPALLIYLTMCLLLGCIRRSDLAVAQGMFAGRLRTP